MRRLLLACASLLLLTQAALAQNHTCPTVPNNTVNNQCANTEFVHNQTGGMTGFATPTANAGLAPIAGVATTAMRSDGAPAINQGIVPTWTGQHTFSLVPIWPPQSLNIVLAGPSSGPSAAPAFRGLVANDMPSATLGYALIGNGAGASSFQGFLNPSAGANTRTWQGKATDIQGILDFPADNTGTNDSTAAFSSALAAQRATHVTSGTFKLNSNPVFNTSSAQLWGGGTTFSGTGSPYGHVATLAAAANAASAQAVIQLASTATLQSGMLVSSQQVTGTSGSLALTACVQNSTTITVTDATHITLSKNLVCQINSGQNLYFQIVNPVMHRGPYTFEFDAIADNSQALNLFNDQHTTTALQLQTVTNFAGGVGNQGASFQIREYHEANQSIDYGSCAAGGCTGPTTSFGALGGIVMNQLIGGDGSINLLNLTQVATGTPLEGFQALLLLQGKQTCNLSSLFCQERIQEIVQDDNGVPAQQTGNIVRQIVTSTMAGLDKRAFLAACTATGASCTSAFATAGFLTGGEYLTGIDFATPLSSGTSHFTANKWARVYNGDSINSVLLGKGGIAYIYVVANSAGTGCPGAGTDVALTITGGGGTGATAKAQLSSSGAVMIAHVTAAGSGFTSAPTVSLAGCSVAPSFGVYLQLDSKTFGTDSSGRTLIYGGDVDGSLNAVGTIKFMNASTSNVMAQFIGSTGGGMSVFNGASAPTGGDKGAGTINAAAGVYVAGASLGGGAGLVPGVPSNTGPTAGNIGEFLSATIGSASASAITTPGTTVVQAVTLSLTAGQWSVCGNVGFITGAGTTSLTGMQAALGTTTSLPAVTAPGQFYDSDAFTIGAVKRYVVSVGCTVFNLSGTTTINLNATVAAAAGGSASAYGNIVAVRSG